MQRLVLAACLAVGAHILFFAANTSWVLPKITPPKWESRPVFLSLQTNNPRPNVQAVKGGVKKKQSHLEKPRHSQPGTAKRPRNRNELVQRRSLKKVKAHGAKRTVLPPDKRLAQVKKKKKAYTAKKTPSVLKALEQPDRNPVAPKSMDSARVQNPQGPSNWSGISDDILPEATGPCTASLPQGLAKEEVVVKARPAYLNNPPPSYPRIARIRGYQGVVILEVLVSKKGVVKDLRVFQTSGYSILDKAAVKAVKNWHFEPGRKGPTPVDMWVKVPVRFVLK